MNALVSGENKLGAYLRDRRHRLDAVALASLTPDWLASPSPARINQPRMAVWEKGLINSTLAPQLGRG